MSVKRLIVHKSATDDAASPDFVVHDGTKLVRTVDDVKNAAKIVLAPGNKEQGTFQTTGVEEALNEDGVTVEVEVEGSTLAATATHTETWAMFEVASLHALNSWRPWAGSKQVKVTLPATNK
jgi:hypothetical protein